MNCVGMSKAQQVGGNTMMIRVLLTTVFLLIGYLFVNGETLEEKTSKLLLIFTKLYIGLSVCVYLIQSVIH